MKNSNASVDVYASPITGVAYMNFVLTYDSTRFEVLSASSPIANAVVNSTVAGQISFSYTNTNSISATISGVVLNFVLKMKDVPQAATSPVTIAQASLTCFPQNGFGTPTLQTVL